jgi:hypothetical protein
VEKPCRVCVNEDGSVSKLRSMIGPCDECVDRAMADAMERFAREVALRQLERITGILYCGGCDNEASSADPVSDLDDSDCRH